MALTQISTQGIKDGTITGTDLATNVDLVDNQKLRLGTGNDLQIYHSGSHSFIDGTGTGNLILKGDSNTQVLGSNVWLLDASGTEFMFKGVQNAQVELYYDNSKKFETTSAGVAVTGQVTIPDGSATGNRLAIGDAQDLALYHNGSNSFIADRGTGPLYIRGNNAVRIEKYVNDSAGEPMIIANADGAVELYHDNSKKFETDTNGVVVTGRLSATTNISAATYLYSGGQVYSDEFISATQSNSSSVSIKARNAVGTEATLIVGNIGGSVDLYHNGSKKFETSSTGVTVTGDILLTFANGYSLFADQSGNFLRLGDSVKLQLGNTGDLEIYHNGFHSYIDDAGTGNLYIRSSQLVLQNAAGDEDLAILTSNGAVKLYYDNSKKFETTSGGADISGDLVIDGAAGGTLTLGGSSAHTSKLVIASNAGNTNGNLLVEGGDGSDFFTINSAGNVIFQDNKKAIFGASDDLQIYHDSSATNNVISGHTGSLNLRNYDTNSTDIILSARNDILLQTAINESAIFCDANAGVHIYHNSTQKFETTSTGVSITGNCNPAANNSHDLGTTSLRWANIYTMDLQLSNEGSTNDVDGTWGSYTIQEGAEDLFLINKRSGKKYKFNLTEVS